MVRLLKLCVIFVEQLDLFVEFRLQQFLRSASSPDKTSCGRVSCRSNAGHGATAVQVLPWPALCINAKGKVLDTRCAKGRLRRSKPTKEEQYGGIFHAEYYAALLSFPLFGALAWSVCLCHACSKHVKTYDIQRYSG